MATIQDRFPHLVIRASAGTGKTFQLSNRFLSLVAAEQPADSILSATFARKAAGEILERVLTRLARAVEDPREASELSKHLGDASLDRDSFAALLTGLLRRLHRLRIGTLDSFFLQFAGTFGLELGLPPGWRICDERLDDALRAEAIQDVLRREETNNVVNLMHHLSRGEVRRSVDAQISDLVSGSRMRSNSGLYGMYVESDRAAWHALARKPTLTDGEVESAVAALESFADLPSHQNYRKGHAGNVQDAMAGNWGTFLSKGIAGAIVDEKDAFYGKPIGDDLRRAYAPLIRHATGFLFNQLAQQTEASWRLLDQFHAAYDRLKQTRRGLRFEDVTRVLSRGLGELDHGDVEFRLDMRLSHLLLDEFQDTSLSQWGVLRRFAAEIAGAPAMPEAKASPRGRAAKSSKSLFPPGGENPPSAVRSFFCVGDVKQAIYGWRGGVAAVFDSVDEALPGLTSRPLDCSYRSSQPVIDVVNQVFESLSRATPLQASPAVLESWGRRFQRHTTARAGLPGYCRLVAAPRAAEGTPQKDVTLSRAAALVAELSARSPGQSVGVLVRTNRAVGDLIHLLRQKHGIAASEEGGNPLTDSAAVQVVLSALRIADHPGDTVSRRHVAGSPLAATLEILAHDDVGAALRASREIREALLRDGYGKTLYGWCRTLAPHYDDREGRRLHKLVELAYAYEPESTARTVDFIAAVESQRVEDPTASAVRVMTVHQAKGLQFDRVVLPELDGKLVGQTPPIVAGRDHPTGPITRVCRYVDKSSRRMLPVEFQNLHDTWHDERVNESLCLLYVAMTRAVHEMHLMIAPSSEKEKKLPETFAGVLRGTLADGAPAAPDAVLFETDPARRAPPDAGAPESSGEAEPVEPAAVVLAAPRAARRRGLERLSPSGMEGGTRVSLDRRMKMDGAEMKARGSLLHAWFEEIEWLDDGEPPDARLLDIAGGIAMPDGDVRRELATFRRMLANDVVRSVLTRDGYRRAQRGASGSPLSPELRTEFQAGRLTADVQRERPFALRRDGALLNGAIDRLVVFHDSGGVVAADIVDYKSDGVSRSDPAKLTERVEHYRPQIDAYREAVAQMMGLPLDRVTARLLFVNEGIVSPV